MAYSVVVLDDDPSVVKVVCDMLGSENVSVEGFTDAGTALARIGEGGTDVLILDLEMPDMHGMEVLRRVKEISPEIEVILLTGYGTVDMAVEAMAGGAFYFLLKPPDRRRLTELVSKAVEKKHLREENALLQNRVKRLEKYLGREPIAESAAMRAVLRLAEQVAPSESTVLITGETGTGKEVVADYIHSRSRRKEMPLVKVNCGAFTETLLESELFGHEKGSFTGATARRIGCLEVANRGTIFLDEIGETSAPMQVKLLRVLQERTIRRVGGNEEIKLDLRFVVATNRNLAERVREGAFREDLYYRINVVPIRIPPLRERTEDIPALVEHFLGRFRERNGRGPERLSSSAMDVLRRHSWPGNVRELENVVERLTVFARGQVVEEDDVANALAIGICQDPRRPSGTGDTGFGVPASAEWAAREQAAVRGCGGAAPGDHGGEPPPAEGAAPNNGAHMAVGETSGNPERDAILVALKRNDWNIFRTALDLKISRSQLYVKLDRYKLLELRPRQRGERP